MQTITFFNKPFIKTADRRQKTLNVQAPLQTARFRPRRLDKRQAHLHRLSRHAAFKGDSASAAGVRQVLGDAGRGGVHREHAGAV
jgi:hypothetical protein